MRKAERSVFLDRDGVINRAFVRDGKASSSVNATKSWRYFPAFLRLSQEL